MAVNKNLVNFKFKKVRKVKSPSRGTLYSAGLDFYIPDDYNPSDLVIGPHKDILIHSGICLDMMCQPIVLLAANKSGVAVSHLAKSKAGVEGRSSKGACVVGACVVDSDFQGEIMLHIINTSSHYVRFSPGDKISQFICLPLCSVELIETESVFETPTERSNGMMGSTGTK